MLSTLLLSQAGTELCREVSPQPMVPPVGKESVGLTSSSPSTVDHFLGALTPVLSHKDYRGICGS